MYLNLSPIRCTLKESTTEKERGRDGGRGWSDKVEHVSEVKSEIERRKKKKRESENNETVRLEGAESCR